MGVIGVAPIPAFSFVSQASNYVSNQKPRSRAYRYEFGDLFLISPTEQTRRACCPNWLQRTDRYPNQHAQSTRRPLRKLVLHLKRGLSPSSDAISGQSASGPSQAPRASGYQTRLLASTASLLAPGLLSTVGAMPTWLPTPRGDSPASVSRLSSPSRARLRR